MWQFIVRLILRNRVSILILIKIPISENQTVRKATARKREKRRESHSKKEGFCGKIKVETKRFNQ